MVRQISLLILTCISIQARAADYGGVTLAIGEESPRIVSATGLYDLQSVGTSLRNDQTYQVRIQFDAGVIKNNYLIELLGQDEHRIAIWIPKKFVNRLSPDRFTVSRLHMIPVQQFDLDVTYSVTEGPAVVTTSKNSCERMPMAVNTGLETYYYCDGTKVDWFETCGLGERSSSEEVVQTMRVARLEFKGEKTITLQTSPLIDNVIKSHNEGECRRIATR
jgi:hypothetical protein